MPGTQTTENRSVSHSEKLKIGGIIALSLGISFATLIYGPAFIYAGIVTASLGAYLIFPTQVENKLRQLKNSAIAGLFGMTLSGPPGFLGATCLYWTIDEKIRETKATINRVIAPVIALAQVPQTVGSGAIQLFNSAKAIMSHSFSSSNEDSASYNSDSAYEPGIIGGWILGRLLQGLEHFPEDDLEIQDSESSDSQAMESEERGYFQSFTSLFNWRQSSHQDASQSSKDRTFRTAQSDGDNESEMIHSIDDSNVSLHAMHVL